MNVTVHAGGEPPFDDVVDIAAAYLFCLCRSDPFVDGDKRTAMIAAIAFLRHDGHRTAAGQRRMGGTRRRRRRLARRPGGSRAPAPQSGARRRRCATSRGAIPGADRLCPANHGLAA